MARIYQMMAICPIAKLQRWAHAVGRSATRTEEPKISETPKPQINHAPRPISKDTIEEAYGMIGQLPDPERVAHPDRSVLDQMVAAGAAQPAQATGAAAAHIGTIR
jgi:hypothetical protein